MESEGQSKRGRLMGKLFGRERKVSNPNEVAPGNDDLSNFFQNSPHDNLPVVHAAPQMLAKLDTSNARRYPNALEVNTPVQQQQLAMRGRPPSTRRRNKRGLVVRFVDTFPEIIGDGGDECTVPTAEIAKRKRAQSAPPPAQARKIAQLQQERERAYTDPKQDDFVPPVLRRTQTGYSTISEDPSPPPPPPPPFLDNSVISNDDKRKSFIEINQAKQRQAEGMAFAKAVRSASTSNEHEWEETKHQVAGPSTPIEANPGSMPPSIAGSPELQQQRRPRLDQSPASTYSQSLQGSPAAVMAQQRSSARDPRLGDSPNKRGTASDMAAAPPLADDALEIFTARTRHLFELFRLQAETVKPIMSSPPDDLARAALWWFLKGRMTLEITIREQPQTPQHASQLQAARQQAYADLAKALWIYEEVLPSVLSTRSSPVDAEVQDVGQTIMSQLRKLSSSMKRNGFLPPEEPFLPQTIDKTIWVEYPAINQDIITLLWGSWGSSIAASQSLTKLPLLAALPLGDTKDLFCFGRYMVDLLLMEQGIEDQKFHFPCFLSVTRSPAQTSLDFCIVSQNGSVQLHIQSNKKGGPTWNDVKWRPENCALELKLPRGFLVVIKCKPQDFKMLWNLQDFSAKALATLQPRKEEQCVFKSKLRSFQYFDSNAKSMTFPRESVLGCEVALFERIAKENSPQGQRTHHRGFRFAVVTGPSTKLLSAVNHMYLPQVPVQFGFLRGENNEPALLLRFDDGGSTGRMVMAFNDEPERLRFHSLLIGTLVQQDEKVFSEVPITGFAITQTAKSDAAPIFSTLPWSRVRVINEDVEGEIPETVLAERLRIIIDFKCGSITDRVNVGPGELKIRLPVKEKTKIQILRPPQQDITVALSESQVAKQLPAEIFQALQLASRGPSIRSFSFTSQRDLHDFQEALTGFKPLFDGVVSLFAIARRRMVVPIYKKWEAAGTRIQIVQSEDNITHVLVFFEDFHHGESMSFQLKATDIFESIKKGDKMGLKIDDAKFPLPLLPENGEKPTDDMAFVCLDMPEIPGEHDDITILFDGEEQRDDFIRCLPAPVKGSRISKTFK
ncbi:hypothetical protein M406DRAFT_287180 [Cryphonectria parasitica EP155]|uniref:Uncharacterized protein n=1 Tax=Cryphonectria parasitica (strain ATCC 38755 / EP155) TaxID=660469 RepID=A0A9P5CTF3_CRYP1|nr:uncharacterized protein M406DRAFT_287180 [Cryphonectria parasitica EP155]KAF3769100.1 hypothetical protein M406DRAFT_287180 [Cryphonectria parasitica EP155]